MSDDSQWIERAQSAEAKLRTLQDQVNRIKEDAQHILTVFGARKKSDGSFDIDFEKFVNNIGQGQAFEVKQIIEAQYGAQESSSESEGSDPAVS